MSIDPRIRRWLRGSMLVAALVAVTWFLVRELPSWSELAASLRQVDPALLAAAAAMEAFSLWLFARQQQVLFAGFGVRVPVRPMVAITYSRSAMSMTFPAGSVMSAVFAVEQFRRFGAGRSTAATVTVLSGAVSVVGLCCLYGVGGAAAWVFPDPWQVIVAVAGALCAAYILVLLAHRRTLPVREHRWPPRQATNRVVRLVRARLADVATLPGRYWAAGIGFATANWAADLACLLLATEAFGADVPPIRLGVLYLGIQLLRQVPISPGGIGVIEAGLVAGLTLVGADHAVATAAALGYRLLSCWLVVPVGLVAWLALTRSGTASATALGPTSTPSPASTT